MSKNLANRIAALESSVQGLLRDAPRKKDQQRQPPQHTADQERNPTPRQGAPLSDIPPTPKDAYEAEDSRYESVKRWKFVLECIAIPFAILYAIVTWFQWRDLRHNFLVDQRAWLNFEAIAKDKKPGTPVEYRLTVGQPATFPLRIENIGKTSALNIVARTFSEIVPADQDPPLDHVKEHPTTPHGTFHVGIIFPGGFAETVIDQTKGVDEGRNFITQAEMDAMQRGAA